MPDMKENIRITVVCDNNPCKEGLETGWGFACVINGAEKTILFDTGPDGSMLLGNMRKLSIDPASIDVVVLSHIHGDHTGGLDDFLRENGRATVYLPQSFPKKFKKNAVGLGAKCIEVVQPMPICENVYSTGQVGKLIKEQALVIQTERGLVLIVGCAHPGLAQIVNSACAYLNGRVFLIVGGFHLEWSTKMGIGRLASLLRRLGVGFVAPCHCCGDKARTLFRECFGQNLICVGAGKVIDTADLR